MVATAGATISDLLHHRGDGEITVYLTLDQEGPCQNGAWPLVWERFVTRLGARNVLAGVNRSGQNAQLGLSGAPRVELSQCTLLGDLFEEAHNTLHCMNEGRRIAESTLTSIMGRMSAYTGRALKFNWAMKASKLDLNPPKYEFGDLEMRPVAVPGKTSLI